jgi:hypothetical protein
VREIAAKKAEDIRRRYEGYTLRKLKTESEETERLESDEALLPDA